MYGTFAFVGACKLQTFLQMRAADALKKNAASKAAKEAAKEGGEKGVELAHEARDGAGDAKDATTTALAAAPAIQITPADGAQGANSGPAPPASPIPPASARGDGGAGMSLDSYRPPKGDGAPSVGAGGDALQPPAATADAPSVPDVSSAQPSSFFRDLVKL